MFVCALRKRRRRRAAAAGAHTHTHTARTHAAPVGSPKGESSKGALRELPCPMAGQGGCVLLLLCGVERGCVLRKVVPWRMVVGGGCHCFAAPRIGRGVARKLGCEALRLRTSAAPGGAGGSRAWAERGRAGAARPHGAAKSLVCVRVPARWHAQARPEMPRRAVFDAACHVRRSPADQLLAKSCCRAHNTRARPPMPSTSLSAASLPPLAAAPMWPHTNAIPASWGVQDYATIPRRGREGVAQQAHKRGRPTAHTRDPPGRSLSRVRLGSDWRLRAESISVASRSWCRRVGSGCGRVALFGSSSLRSHTALGQPKTLRPSLKGVPCTPWGWVIDATKDRS